MTSYRSWKRPIRCMVATAVATALWTTALVSAPSQQPGIVVQKIEVKIETKPAEKKDAPAEKAEAPVEKKVVEEKAVRVQQKVAAAGGANAQAAALTQQYIRQLQPILEAELRLVSTCCELNPEQRRELAFHGAEALRRVATKLAEGQGRIQPGRMPNNMIDPRKMAVDAMEAAAKEKLTPEHFEKYKSELTARAKEQREAEVMYLTASIDKLLTLSADQREKLCDNLRRQWDELNYPTIESISIYDGYFPVINTNSIYPILTDDQKKIWTSANKITYAQVRGFNFFNNQMNLAGESEDPDVKAAFAAGEKK